MILSDLALQICQVLCVLLLAPLLQGFILRTEERVQRSRGPSLLQPYRDLWKLFHKESVVPESASWIYWIAPIIAFTAMLIVPILIPVLTDRPLPLSDMGDMLGAGWSSLSDRLPSFSLASIPAMCTVASDRAAL